MLAIGAALLWSATLSADTIQLSDGSSLNGEIEGVSGGKIMITTAFAGVLQIDQALVTGITTQKELHFAFASGNVLVGKASSQGGKTEISTVHGALDVTKDVLTAAWKPGARSPLEPPPPTPREWKYEVAIDVSGKTGNAEANNVGGSFKATLAGEHDKLMFYVGGRRSEENHVKSEDELIGGTDYENMVGERHAWYVRTKFEIDDIELLDLRAVAAAGYGYYFLKAPEHELRGRVGFMFQSESYMDEAGIDDNTSPGLDVGGYHMWKLNEWCKMINEITYTPTFDDWQDYQVFHNTSLDMPLGTLEMWTLRLGLTHNYSSMPAQGKDRLDTTYSGQIVLSF